MSQQHPESGDCENYIENSSMAATGDWSLVTIKDTGNEVGMVNADLDQPKLQLSELEIKILQGCAKGDDQGCDKVDNGIQAKPLEELKVMLTFLDEKYLNEIVELKVKNLALTQENKAFGEKLKVAEAKIEMEKNELKETIKTIQQGMDELSKENFELKVVLDSHSLEKAMLQPTSAPADEPSPLEQFLLGKNLLARLRPFFALAEKEARNRERGKLNLPVKEVHWAQGILTVKFLSYPMPFSTSANYGQQHQLQCCQIRLQLFICPKKFGLIAKLEYSGTNCPADSDVYIFERFFANQVSRINNELAVFAFITLCRLSSPTIYASVAQLMLAQMEKPQHYPWRIEFELLHLMEQQLTTTTAVAPLSSGQKAHQSQPQKNVQISIQVTDMCKQFLLILYLHPNHQQTPLRGLSPRVDKRRLIFRYIVERNELTLYTPPNQQMTESEQHIANVLKAQTELVNTQQQQMNIGGGGNNNLSQSHQPQCCIWSCIRALLEGQHVPLIAYES